MESQVTPVAEPIGHDGTRLALLTVAAALTLFVAFFLPWLNLSVAGFELTWAPEAGGSLTTGDLLSPFVALVAGVVTLVALVMPSRGARVTVLLTFCLAAWAAELELTDYFFGDKSGWVVQPPLGIGLPIYALAAGVGLIAAAVAAVPAESSTVVWRAIGRPSLRAFAGKIAYGVGLLVTLPIVLFPMFPRWWLLVWLIALAVGLLIPVGGRLRSGLRLTRGRRGL